MDHSSEDPNGAEMDVESTTMKTSGNDAKSIREEANKRYNDPLADLSTIYHSRPFLCKNWIFVRIFFKQ